MTAIGVGIFGFAWLLGHRWPMQRLDRWSDWVMLMALELGSFLALSGLCQWLWEIAP